MSEKWNGEFGEKCNLPIDCIDCDIVECPGRKSERIPALKIPFLERFREPLLNGTKTLTTRRKRYGKRGELFEAFGVLFVLTNVERRSLAFAIENWKREGCKSQADFLAVWKQIHPKKPLNKRELFWVHSFKRFIPSGK